MKRTEADSEDFVIKQIKGDKIIWIIFFLLALSSAVLVYSASGSLAFKANTSNFPFLVKQLKYLGIGFIGLYMCYKIPIGYYRLLAIPALIFSILLSIVMLGSSGSVNNAVRWMSIGSTTFQPTEIAKVAIVMYLARIIEISKFDTFKEYIIRILIPVGIICVLMLVSSASTAIFLGIVSFTILYMAGIKGSYLWKSVGIAGIGLVVILIIHFTTGAFSRLDTATSRITKYFQSEEAKEEMSEEKRREMEEKTFQADMAKIAISSVGITGKGPGKSTQRYVLPHAYSDYIYTIIIEEYGLFGGVVVLMLYLWLLYRCVVLIRRCTKLFTAIIVGGYGFLITSQALLHILVNVGILPVTGHTLPLISSGGTSIVMVCCMFGIILSVSRTIDMADKKRETNQRETNEK